jgi:predicted  nucleic acid-binding Zn-ribbon protein
MALKRLFQFRSAQRDAQADQQRVGSVVQAIDAALEAAVNERDALRARVDQARDLASFAVGTGDDEYLTREARDTSRIADYERQMTIGEKRIRALDQQISSLKALQDLSSRCFLNQNLS